MIDFNDQSISRFVCYEFAKMAIAKSRTLRNPGQRMLCDLSAFDRQRRRPLQVYFLNRLNLTANTSYKHTVDYSVSQEHPSKGITTTRSYAISFGKRECFLSIKGQARRVEGDRLMIYKGGRYEF